MSISLKKKKSFSVFNPSKIKPKQIIRRCFKCRSVISGRCQQWSIANVAGLNLIWMTVMGPGGVRHGYIPKTSDGEEDPVEKMIKDTGCLELHHQVQSCIFETGDWRKCQKHVQEFRKCMDEHRKKTEGKSN